MSRAADIPRNIALNAKLTKLAYEFRCIFRIETENYYIIICFLVNLYKGNKKLPWRELLQI
jgi:hypothetical protein